MSELAGIYRAIAEERARLDRRELAASARLAAAYRLALESLIPLFDEITDRIAARRASGQPVTPGWLFAQARYRHMIEEVRRQSRELALVTGNALLDESAAAARLGNDQALELLGLAIPADTSPLVVSSFSGVNDQALATLTAEMGPTSPLVAILAEFPADAERALRSGLVRGMALGLGADEIARGMRSALGGNLVRANTIIRTEIHRAHREATRAAFQANSAHLNGWIWMADLSPRTCAACWAMHGTKHPLTESMQSHPNCRCSMAPWTKSFRELGINVPDELETRLDVPTGSEVFAALLPWQQRAILGPGGYALYRTGRVALTDFVKVTRSKEWGESRTVRPVREIARGKGIPVPGWTKTIPTGGVGLPPTVGGASADDPGPSPMPQLYRQTNALPAIDAEGHRLGVLTDARRAHSDANWAALGDGPSFMMNGKAISEKELLETAVHFYTEPTFILNYHLIRDALEELAHGRPASFEVAGPLAWSIGRAIHFSEPLPIPIYRGMSSPDFDPIDLGEIGDMLDLSGSASFAASEAIAYGFANHTTPGTPRRPSHLPGHVTIIVVLPGAKGLKVDALANWNQTEVITAGLFEIVDIQRTHGRRDNGLDYEETIYTVAQRIVWEPTAQPPGADD